MPVLPPWRFALAAVLCLAAAARSQTTAPPVTVSPNQFGGDRCRTQSAITVKWDFGTGFIPGTTVTFIFSTSADCNTTSGSPATSPTQTQTGSFTVLPSDLLFGQTLRNDCGAPVTSASPGTVYACAKVGTTALTGVPVTFALQPPKPPISIVVEEGNQHLKLSWSPGDAAEKIGSYSLYAAAISQAPDAGTSDAGTSDAGTADGGVAGFGDPVQTNITAHNTDLQTINGAPLKNDTTYGVALIAIDQFGNTSELSDPAFGTPKAIDDFYQHYRDANGGAQGGGGCSSLGGAGGLVAVLAALWFARRRRAGPLLLLLAALALPSAARAQGDIGQVLRARDERPPRRLLIALKIDRYDPQIDSEPGLNGAHPYRDIFRGRAPLRWQLEGGFEAWHPFGTFIIGATAGYWQNIGKGLNHSDLARSADTALLDILPFGLVGTYRFDWAADKFRFPIIPYAQIGAQAALWASFNGRGDVTTRSGDQVNNPGGHGSGWSTGWTGALGVALALDFIDPSLSREAFHDVHLQRTSLFAEYGWTHLGSTFNKGGTLILSDRAWRFGLSLEF